MNLNKRFRRNIYVNPTKQCIIIEFKLILDVVDLYKDSVGWLISFRFGSGIVWNGSCICGPHLVVL